MQIDYALILSAGMGTRMGEIGKKLPKVLWPVYFKTLLELQVLYCQELGIPKIYINTHFLHDEIMTFLETSGLAPAVTVLHEDPLLDSGGAIHHLAARDEVQYKGNVLLVNGDQFLFFDPLLFKRSLQRLENSRAVLFGIKVDSASSYNETIVENDLLVEIRKNTDKNRDYVTYSGLGLLKLDGLKRAPGISRFFDTVANFKDESISLLTPETFEYWDFGTAEIYAQNIFKLQAQLHSESAMYKFLGRHDALNGPVNKFLDQSIRAIDLESSGQLRENSIHGQGLFQKI